MVIYTMHQVDEEKLVGVMEDAKSAGSVTLNVYFDGEVYHTLEGVHRTEAAKRLCLPIVLVCREWEEVVSHDIPDLSEEATVADVVDYGYTRHYGSVYTHNDFASVDVVR